MTRLIVGSVAFAAGALLWFYSRAGASPAARPAHVSTRPRAGLALAALGLSTLASAQPGLGWSISSICFSVVAIVLIVTVLRDSMRR
jgi:hypothetical protein